MRSIRPRYLLFSIAGIAALVIASAGISTVGRPGTCNRCHAPLVAALEKSAHRGVDCYACHADSGVMGEASRVAHELGSMYPRAVVGVKLTRPVVQIAGARCLACHANVYAGVTEGPAIRIKHSVCATGTSCDPCHSMTAHGEATRWQTTPAMDDCMACHSERGASVACETCHVADPKQTDAPEARTAWNVTHGKNWRSAHGMGDISSCKTCHPGAYCSRCHGVELPHPVNFGDTHGDAAIKDRSKCRTCHPGDQICNQCHGMQMPHPKGFLQQHSKIARGLEDKRCFTCHTDTDCGTCHGYHAHPGGAVGVPVPWTLTNPSMQPGGGK